MDIPCVPVGEVAWHLLCSRWGGRITTYSTLLYAIGIFWDSLGYFGIFWDFLGYFGIFWDFLGFLNPKVSYVRDTELSSCWETNESISTILN
jgi:hypothetical protein